MDGDDLTALASGIVKPVNYCTQCGTHRVGSIGPLSKIATEIQARKFLDIGYIVTPHSFPDSPPDPLPLPMVAIAWRAVLFGIALAIFLVIGYLVSDDGFAVDNFSKIGLTVLGATLLAGILYYFKQTVKVPCPQCQSNLLLFRLGDRSSLIRRFRYLLVGGKYIKTILPRFCPFCGYSLDPYQTAEGKSGPEQSP